MRRIIFFLLVGFLFANCSHRIVRTGYDIHKSDYRTCDVIIKKNISVSDTIVTKIGDIKIGESGFSVTCSEEHAINILKGEACAINADLIIITEENRPDLWSSCYRCSAGFYKYNSTDIEKNIENDATYRPDNVKRRVSKDRAQNTGIFIGSVVVAILIGLLTF
jgi:hypothetical protein